MKRKAIHLDERYIAKDVRYHGDQATVVVIELYQPLGLTLVGGQRKNWQAKVTLDGKEYSITVSKILRPAP